MFKQDMIKLASGVLAAAVVLLALSACGGPVPGAVAEEPPTLTETPVAATPTSTPTPPPPPPPTPTPTLAAPSGDAVLERGKLIFDKTAGGIGCAACHGLDGKGNGPAKVNAPDIRSKTEADVRAAVAGGVPMMQAIIKLTDDEFAAVAAYIASLP
ncbi:MAG: cytochrome c [Chloroflexi bacterium]|nr:cytochrome c [Chloroflexota bacterium]